MKVTLTLTPAQVKGIKAYLQETCGGKITALEIKNEIKGMVDASLQTGAVNDYIQQFEII